MFQRLLDTWRGFRSMSTMRELALDLHLGHHKCIGREAGLPVHSLFIPADYSRAMAYAQARFYNALRFGRLPPIIASLGLTSKCPCACSHCSAAGPCGGDRDTNAWKRDIAAVQNLGVMSLVLSGGEPLARSDLEELIAAVDHDRSSVVLATCGVGLAERASSLYAAGLRRVFVSVDFKDAAAHDQHRRREGCHAEALAGLQACRKLGMLVGMSTFADPQRLDDGVLDGVWALAKSERVNELAVFEHMPSGRAKGTAPPACHPWHEQLAEWHRRTLQTDKRIGIWSYQQNRSNEASGCAHGLTYLRIANDGRVLGCDFDDKVWGDTKETPLAQVWARMQHAARQRPAGGCRVLDRQETAALATAAAG